MARPDLTRRLFLPILAFFLAVPPALARDEVGLYDYAMKDLEGKAATLSPYRGKILVVEFFATWCAPCRKDLPQVASLLESYPPEKVIFVAVSADGVSKTEPNLPGFLKETGLKAPVLVGGGIFVDTFAGVGETSGREITLPQTYVFSGEGEVLMRLVGEQRSKKRILKEELDRILTEAASPKAAP
jgi:thiol-disulfide isomerase/thioredoxin